MDKLISQQAAIDTIKKRLFETAFNNIGIKQNVDETLVDVAENRLENWFGELPSVQLNHNAEVSKMGIVHCEDCEHWDTSWETVYGLHYCPMIDMSTKKNFFCKYGAEKRGEVDETD